MGESSLEDKNDVRKPPVKEPFHIYLSCLMRIIVSLKSVGLALDGAVPFPLCISALTIAKFDIKEHSQFED